MGGLPSTIKGGPFVRLGELLDGESPVKWGNEKAGTSSKAGVKAAITVLDTYGL